jgi:hypothetical protein
VWPRRDWFKKADESRLGEHTGYRGLLLAAAANSAPAKKRFIDQAAPCQASAVCRYFRALAYSLPARFFSKKISVHSAFYTLLRSRLLRLRRTHRVCSQAEKKKISRIRITGERRSASARIRESSALKITTFVLRQLTTWGHPTDYTCPGGFMYTKRMSVFPGSGEVADQLMAGEDGICEQRGFGFRAISPTRKRTEGHAPLWGSEFTTKVATLKGGSAEIAAGLKHNFALQPAWLRGASLSFWNS